MVSIKVIPNQQSRLPALQVSAASRPVGCAGTWLWGRVGPEQTMRDQRWGESCAEPGEGQGDGCPVTLPELLEDEGTCPVLTSLQTSRFWPHVDVFTQCVCRNVHLGCLSHSGTCAVFGDGTAAARAHQEA